MNDALTVRQSDAIIQLVFEHRIRRIDHQGKLYYSLVDLVAVFADTKNQARRYWSDTKKRLVEDGFQVSENIGQFKMLAADGKMRLTDCGDIITVRRVIMSIPSEKAEPLRMYMAGKSDALLTYRTINVLHGSEWAADSVHKRIESLGTDDLFDDPFTEMGYKR